MILSPLACRLAAATIAMFALPISAYAYSTEAVKDARELVRITTNKSLMGLADATEVGLAQYHLLAMEYEARLISHADYCKSVQPQLRIVASGFEPERYRQIGLAAPLTKQQQTDLKKQWQDQVAAMNQSLGACDAATAITERVVFGMDDEKNSEEAVKNAEAWIKAMEQRYAAGTIDAMEFWETQLDLLAAQYRDKQIALKGYCQSGRQVVTNMEALDQNRKQAPHDQTLIELIAMKRHVYQFKALCREN
jgi:aerobic-type carbon monoxide dehydrogenase small subunit (CoxS/CutS family)